MGIGGFAEPPKPGADYRRGYLCGMIRGDGTIHEGRHQRADGSMYHLRQFRLALTDQEALDRTRTYLSRLGVACTEFIFTKATAARRQLAAIRCGGLDNVGFIRWLIGWPDEPSLDWRKGFLAGVFDAEGSYSRGILRISNTDPDLLAWLRSSLHELGFAFATEQDSRDRAKPLTYYRLTGGLPETLRFFLTTDPAITRKRSIDGTALKSNARLGITSIEPLGLDLPMYDITTGTGDFVANGVVSHNCFARNTHTYLDLDAGHDFDSKIVVKVNAPALVRKELNSPRWQGEHIAMGTNVDVYQRAEGKYQLMPGILQALLDARNPYSILTKGTLILRDLDLLLASAEVTDVGLSVSVGCADEDLWRAVEPGTPSPRRRLGVCGTLSEHGLPLRRADGPGGAVPVRLPRPAGVHRAADRRGGRHPRQPDRAAPAARRPGVVPGLAGRAPPRPGPALPGAVRLAGLRAQGLPAADRRAGPRARRAVPRGPRQPARQPAHLAPRVPGRRPRRACRGAAHPALTGPRAPSRPPGPAPGPDSDVDVKARYDV